MDYSSHRVKDLTETIINDGSTYNHRLVYARNEANKSYKSIYTAGDWLHLVGMAASKYERQFQPDEKFTVQDLLETALHLSAYYAQHLAEFDVPTS